MACSSTRPQSDGTIFRAYRCLSSKCKHKVKSLEVFIEHRSTKQPTETDRLRTIKLQTSVIELLREVAEGRAHLNVIEQKLLTAFNEGIATEPKGEATAVVTGQPYKLSYPITANSPHRDEVLRRSEEGDKRGSGSVPPNARKRS